MAGPLRTKKPFDWMLGRIERKNKLASSLFQQHSSSKGTVKRFERRRKIERKPVFIMGRTKLGE